MRQSRQFMFYRVHTLTALANLWSQLGPFFFFSNRRDGRTPRKFRSGKLFKPLLYVFPKLLAALRVACDRFRAALLPGASDR